MGRAKLNMELISKEKSRNITFKKRKEGLIRKMHEFTTLCDVSACMIIYAPKHDKSGSNEPEIWPQDMEEVRRILDIYKSKNKDSGNKTFGLSDFFHDRKRKIEEELAKLKKKNMESKYPTWPDFMNFMTEPRLREFGAALTEKSNYVKSRIDFLKRNKEGGSLIDFSPHSRLAHQSSHIFNLEVINQVKPIEMHHVPIQYPTNMDHHHQNSMMMLLMNDGSEYKRQVFYESSSGRGVVDPALMCHANSPKAFARYYGGPTVQVPVQVQPPFVQMAAGPAVMPSVLPHMHYNFNNNNNGNNNNNISYNSYNHHDGGGGDGQEDHHVGSATTQYQMMTHHNRGRYYNE